MNIRKLGLRQGFRLIHALVLAGLLVLLGTVLGWLPLGTTTALWIGAGLLAMILIVGQFFLVHPLLRSMERLRTRLGQLAEAEGDLCARLDVVGDDEVADLAAAFNTFLGKIAGLVMAVRKSSIQLTSTSTELAATSREQEATVNAFGSSTNQIAASVQQISATGAELMRTIDDVQDIAHNSASIGRDRSGAPGEDGIDDVAALREQHVDLRQALGDQ